MILILIHSIYIQNTLSSWEGSDPKNRLTERVGTICPDDIPVEKLSFKPRQERYKVFL